MLLLQPLKETGAFRFFREHAQRQFRFPVTEFANPERFYRKRSHTRVTDRQCFRRHRIPGDLNGRTDQRCTDFVFAAFEADTGPLVHFACIMMQECLSYDPGVQVFQRTGITVELLPGCYALGRYVDPVTLIVLPDALMGLVVVVVLDKELPPVPGLFQGLYLLGAAFSDVTVDQAVIDLDFPFTLAGIRLRPEVPYAKPGQCVE